MARMGLQCGVNANLLRRWIVERQKAVASSPAMLAKHPDSAPFVPLQIETIRAQTNHPRVANVELHARLPNGVQVDLKAASLDDMTRVIEALGGLKCSVSMKP